MPEVTGKQLDVAKSDIKRAGFRGDVEVLGGGLFGVLDESNWLVCAQLPPTGSAITDAPRLEVDRSCGGDASAAPTATPSAAEPNPTASDEAETPSPEPSEPEQAVAVDAKAIEKKFKEHLRANAVDKIDDMCDDDLTHWSCFYDGVTDGGGYLEVDLSTDGGWSESDLDEMADSAGRHWFNFIGCDFPDLDTVVVTINGVDHNVFRSDTMVDSTCG